MAITQEKWYGQALKRAPPLASRPPAPAEPPRDSIQLPRWEQLPAWNRQRLSQIVAQVIARHRLLTDQEVPND